MLKNVKRLHLYVVFLGERSQDKEDILQEQGMQEAHPAQGYPIQEG